MSITSLLKGLDVIRDGYLFLTLSREIELSFKKGFWVYHKGYPGCFYENMPFAVPIRVHIRYINPDGSSFFLSPTVPAEIAKIIDSLDLTKSTGPNGIPVFLLKHFFKLFFSNWLSKLVNLCFETSVFPDLLKLAKKENKLEFLNYRPISYPFLAKYMKSLFIPEFIPI